MKIWIQTCLVFMGIFIGLNVVPVEAQSFDQLEFEWLIGKWERTDTKTGQQAFEEWVSVSDVLYTGKGWTMEGKDTIFEEHLRIYVSENKFFYEAEVAHNPGPVRFEIVEWDDSKFESVNLKHDFPTNIDYEHDKAGKLIVTISDQKKEMHFQFRKLSE